MKKVRIGVIGCGGMARGHMRQIENINTLKLTAVCDNFPDAAREVGENYGVPYFTDHEKLIASGHCEAVLIATPHYFHPVIGICAFEAGLHVLTEKPLCVTVSEADRFLDAARRSGKVFSIMHQQRLNPDFQVARKLVESGKLGEIRRTMLVDLWFRTQAYYDSGGWRGTWAGEGGGVLLNQAPHKIDLFMLLGGLPRRVTANSRTRAHDIEIEDEVSAFLEYDNGAWGQFYASTMEAPQKSMFELSGDSGKIFWRHGEKLEFHSIEPSLSDQIKTSEGTFAEPRIRKVGLRFPAATGSSHAANMRDFARAILYGKPLAAPGEEGLWSIEFINALILSGYKKKPVEIPVNREEYDALLNRLKKTSRIKNVVDKRVTDTSRRI